MKYKAFLMAGIIGTGTFILLIGYGGTTHCIAGDIIIESNACNRVLTVETDMGVNFTINSRTITILGKAGQPLTIWQDTSNSRIELKRCNSVID